MIDYKETIEALSRKEIATTFPAIRKEAEELNNWEISETVNDLWNTYSHMLSFLSRGFVDPQCEKIRDSIIENLVYVVYKIRRQERVKSNPLGAYAVSYKQSGNIQSLESAITSLESKCTEIHDTKEDASIEEAQKETALADLYKTKDDLLLGIFNKVWTSIQWQNSDTDQASSMLFSDAITANDKCVLVSALTLSLLDVPDKAKLLMLLDCYLIGDTRISQRALTGFILAYNTFCNIYDQCEEISDRLSIYGSNSDFVQDICNAMMQLQLTALTEKMNNKLHRDIMPNLFNSAAQQTRSGQEAADVSELIERGLNPEWVGEKADNAMLDMNLMVREGIDLHFSSLGKYKPASFFSRIPHWFYPFSIDQLTYIGQCKLDNPMQRKLLRMMFAMDQFCDSDRYSMCYMMQQMSVLDNKANDILCDKVSSNFEDASDIVEEQKKASLSKPSVRRKYIQDLYRFFKVNPHHHEFANPLDALKSNPLSPLDYEWTKKMVAGDKHAIRKYADFMMRYDFYDKALDLYHAIASNDVDAQYASIWQKIGFCYQQLGRDEDALKAYYVSNDLKRNSKWTLSHIASEEMTLHLWKEAAHHYAMLLEMDAGNSEYMRCLAEALTSMSRYDEALPILYKLNYIIEDNASKLDLAYTLLALGKHEEAENELKRFESDDKMQICKSHILQGVCAILKGSLAEGYALFSPNYTAELDAYIGECIDLAVKQKRMDRQVKTLVMDALRLHVTPDCM